MSHYRGYFMKDGHIVAPAIIEAADDAQAMLKAGELLTTSQSHRSVAGNADSRRLVCSSAI